MPCNIGYRSYSRTRIPASQSQKFKSKTKPPKIDEELLERLGEEDSKFLEWLQELDIVPLLEEALQRTQKKIDWPDLMKFFINSAGYLEVETKYRSAAEKGEIERITNLVFDQFQLETLGIVLQLLDYEVVISNKEKGAFTLEGEKMEEKNVHKYVKVTKTADGEASLRFEHFESRESLVKERDKFLALSQKLGVKMDVVETEETGQPIPEGVVHQDFLREKN